jgi:hypothetical protein
LSSAPWITGSIASSAALRVTASDLRPERIAVRMPSFCSIFTPCPSWMLNGLKTSPCGPIHKVPSVSTPSTSKIARRTARARA